MDSLHVRVHVQSVSLIANISLRTSLALDKAEALCVSVDLGSLIMDRFSRSLSEFKNVDNTTELPPLIFPLRIYNNPRIYSM